MSRTIRRPTRKKVAGAIGTLTVGAIGVVIGTLLLRQWILYGFHPVDTSGKGHEFVLYGTVAESGHDDLQISDIEIESAANGTPWLMRYAPHIYDYYKTCTWTTNEHHIGVVLRNGHPAQLDDLRVGDRVLVKGKVRASQSCDEDGSVTEQRAVFDELDIERDP